MTDKLKEELEKIDDNYLFIQFLDDGVQMLTTLDPVDLIEALEFLLESLQKGQKIYVHSGSTH